MSQRAITQTKQTQVCIVEDEMDIRDLYTKICQTQNYKVFSADCKETTLELVDSGMIDQSKHTIWLLDWCIPPDNAIDLTRELLFRNISGPFILVTASIYIENIDEDIKTNSPYRLFREKLIKPVSVQKLLDTIRKYVM